jgi:hypothetical protein
MRGDILDFDQSNIFCDMNKGSIIEVLAGRKTFKEFIGCYIMRCDDETDQAFGVTIYHPNGHDVGNFWGDTPIDEISYKILKEV